MQPLKLILRVPIYLLFFSLNSIQAAGLNLELEAEKAVLGPDVVVVQEELFPSKKGIMRKKGSDQKSELQRSDFKVDSTRPADLVFNLKIKKPGMYSIITTSAVDEVTARFLEKARSKMDSLSLMISIDKGFPSSRVVVPAWKKTKQWTFGLGVFHFASENVVIRIWLPDGLILDELHVRPHNAPKIPKEAASYRPAIVPPKDHPRLWITPDILPIIRKRLTKGENADVWEKVQKASAAPFHYEFPDKSTISHNKHLLQYVQMNAFVWQMTGDRKSGRRAIDLIIPYLNRVEYGNMLDITRELGDSIYTGALVFDWCYSLLTGEEKKSIYDAQIRLSYFMETGWPPFRQSIIIGHGNEGQILKNFLAMSIAFYELDPIPYQYCSWRIFEELVPMRRFEYQSPRHNQGIAYIGARLYWEYLAALMYKRMVSKEIFDANIKGIRDYLLFMRLPNGEMFRDGDNYLSGSWWSYPGLALAMYSYGEDPVMKGEFQRQTQKGIGDPIQFLLLNDPDLVADSSFDSLPLAYDSGKILCSQILRTGWNFGPESDDTLVEFKGGSYHFGNHQHSDSGAFQIWHRGLLATDLGIYRFYGTEYDYNFNKRSISHNVMLVLDPEESFYRDGINDGGQRFVPGNPGTPERTVSDPQFKTGNLLDSRILPSRKKPEISFFTVDLTSAYSKKVREYIRSFCWIKTGRKDLPVVVIVFDRLISSDPSFKKYWQINTLTKPISTSKGEWTALSLDRAGSAQKPLKRGQIRLRTLIPDPDKIEEDLIGGANANSIFGHKLTPPPNAPENEGWRLMLSPKTKNEKDLFLNVLFIGDEGANDLPVQFEDMGKYYRIVIAGKTVLLNQFGHFELKSN